LARVCRAELRQEKRRDRGLNARKLMLLVLSRLGVIDVANSKLRKQ
jgi:hypothetical protein